MPLPPFVELKDSVPLTPAGSETWDFLSSEPRFYLLGKGALRGPGWGQSYR